MSTLDDLRTRIQELDASLLRVIAERMDVAREIGRLKRAAGVPLRDWEVERRVLARAAEAAGPQGLRDDFVRELMRHIIGESRATQERSEYSEYRGAAADIAVIGGRGRMGRWFVDFFRNQGHRVRVVDVAGDPETVSLEAALATAEVALLATPLETVPATIRAVIATGFDGIAVDIASLKSHLVEAVADAQAAGVRYVSLHPMFGPGVQTLAGQVFVLCDCGDTAATQRVRGFFAETAASLVELSFAEHDRVATYVLGLSHYVNVVLARTLERSGLPHELLARIGSTTFHSQMQTTATVIREQPQLYYAIQKLNAFSPQMYAAFAAEAGAVAEAVQHGRREDFVAMMTAARAWMAEA